jgi:hypothetical protein
MGDDPVLRTCWWHIAVVMVVVGIAVPAAPTVSIAAAQKPRPEKLWDAYPLDPGQEGAEPADPAPTPTASPGRPAGSPGRSAASEDEGGAVLAPALIGGAAFVVGLGAGEVVRRRRRRATAAQVAERNVAPAAAGAPAAPGTVDFRPRAPQPPEAPSDGAPERERPDAAAEPPSVPSPQVSVPAGWIAPAPSRANPPSSPQRFARVREWPEEAARAWTCEIDWKPGYIKSGFRAMAAPPGELRRKALGQSRPVKWTFMGDPDPPTQDMVEVLQELVTALTENGWVRVGPGDHWYSQRFLWAGNGQPRPLAPLTGKEANA